MSLITRNRLATVAVALALAVTAGCSGGDNTEGVFPESSGALAAGCENVDLTVESIGQAVPQRCEPGAPAAQRLAKPATVKIASNQFTGEYTSPIQVGMAMGEFEKEGLTIELVNLPYVDAAPQVSSGALDAAVGGFDSAFYSAVKQGLQLKAVTALQKSPHAGDTSIGQAGLWCRRDAFSSPANPNFAETAKMTWGSSVGKGSVGIIQAVIQLKDQFPNTDFNGIDVETVPVPDSVTAINNKAIDCGYLIDPVWLGMNESDHVLVATQLAGVSASQVTFGPTLFKERPEVGVAFVRALLRTVNTYLADDYHADDSVMSAIEKFTKRPVADLRKVDSLVFDPAIPSGATDVYQKAYIDMGIITAFDTPIAESELVDRRFLERAYQAN